MEKCWDPFHKRLQLLWVLKRRRKTRYKVYIATTISLLLPSRFYKILPKLHQFVIPCRKAQIVIESPVKPGRLVLVISLSHSKVIWNLFEIHEFQYQIYFWSFCFCSWHVSPDWTSQVLLKIVTTVFDDFPKTTECMLKYLNPPVRVQKLALSYKPNSYVHTLESSHISP